MPTTTRPAIEFDGEFLRKLEYLNVVARKILAGSLRADRQSPRRGTSAEFADHRSYTEETTSATSIGICSAAWKSSSSSATARKKIYISRSCST